MRPSASGMALRLPRHSKDIRDLWDMGFLKNWFGRWSGATEEVISKHLPQRKWRLERILDDRVVFIDRRRGRFGKGPPAKKGQQQRDEKLFHDSFGGSLYGPLYFAGHLQIQGGEDDFRGLPSGLGDQG